VVQFKVSFFVQLQISAQVSPRCLEFPYLFQGEAQAGKQVRERTFFRVLNVRFVLVFFH
jgi:hypothetical protein